MSNSSYPKVRLSTLDNGPCSYSADPRFGAVQGCAGDVSHLFPSGWVDTSRWDSIPVFERNSDVEGVRGLDERLDLG